MQLARLIMINRIKLFFKISFTLISLLFFHTLFAQENSPYSRYGLGDIVPNTNIVNRSMGGVSAAYADGLSVNFNNPASYSAFKSYLEEKSKKVLSGRVVLDVGINMNNRTLQQPNQTQSFTTSNLIFSYLQLGIPLTKNWGLSFGLRPVTRIGYKILRTEQLRNPVSGAVIDSASTEFDGSGGSYLPSIGTGFAIKNFSIGANMGYLFGKKEYVTTRTFLNDSVVYNNAVDTNRTSFGSLFFNAGVQYKINFSKQTFLRLGLSGNLKQTIGGTQDIITNTIIKDPTNGDSKLDSVYAQKGVKGKITYPASYTAGFLLDHTNTDASGWSFGADYIKTKWSDYRFFGTIDSVQDDWQIRVGGQVRPKPTRNYFSNVAYRAGFFVGRDYLKVQGNLPLYGVSVGMGLPLANYNRLSPGQYTIVNVGLEYERRGNNQNVLKENTFRLSIGLNFSDLWFNKRKYE